MKLIKAEVSLHYVLKRLVKRIWGVCPRAKILLRAGAKSEITETAVNRVRKMSLQAVNSEQDANAMMNKCIRYFEETFQNGSSEAIALQ